MRVHGDQTARMRDDHNHRAVGEVADERHAPVSRREHRLPEHRGDVDRIVEVRVVHAAEGARRLERERRRSEWLCDRAAHGKRPGRGRGTVARHRRRDQLGQRGLRRGRVAREGLEHRDLGRAFVALAVRGRGGDRSRAVAEPAELPLLRGNGLACLCELRHAIGKTKLRVVERCVDGEQLPIGLDLRVAQRRERGRRARGRESERVAREALADRPAIVGLRLERGDVGADRVQIPGDPVHLRVERRELVAGDERLGVDDLGERLRAAEELRVTRARRFELLGRWRRRGRWRGDRCRGRRRTRRRGGRPG